MTLPNEFGFRMPNNEYEAWADQAVEGLVGQEGVVTFFGHDTKGRITSAKRYDDPMLGPGIWLTVVSVET